MSIAPGTKLGRYEIRSKIGAGGMGEVYLADDTQLGRKVALKVLPPDLTDNKGRLQRFEQEARAASALNHPNILTIYEIGKTEDTHFIATEFIEGENVRELSRKKRLTVDEALDVATQVASALDSAHQAGIVHRDIKPENIMLRRDQLVKVLDFGLAKLTKEFAENSGTNSQAPTMAPMLTNPGVIMGTFAYMSPEQARGLAVDERTDIFSLGVVFYQMLTGQKPFHGDTAGDLIASVIRSEAAPLRQLDPGIPAELERIVLKSLEKDQDERYQTAKDLLVDLRKAKKQIEFAAEFEPTTSGSASKSPEPPPMTSIAVLPFANMSVDVENEYFCDGLAEELLNALAKIEGLKVAARTSAFSFKGKNTNITDIARRLNVSTVLEGSVRRSGDRLRITAQLISAADGYHLWSERYDRQMRDIFDIQDEITLAIVGALKVQLLGEGKAVVLKRYTDNTEAYQLYLKGRHHLNQYTEEGWRVGAEYFQQAIDKEPDYAPAYAGLALCYGANWFFGSVPPHEIVPKWKAAVRRALEIDANLAEAHYTLASIHFYCEWNWEKAEQEHQRAFELNPNSPDAHWRYGLFLCARNQFDKATEEAKRALELDPLSLMVRFFATWIFLFAQRLDLATKHAKRMLEMEPRFYGGHWQIGAVYSARRMYDESIEAYEKALALGGSPRYPILLSYLGNKYGVAGRTEEARGALAQLLELSQSQYIAPINIARVYGGLGENDKAFEWMEKAYEERNGALVFLGLETGGGLGTLYDESFCHDPRLADLLGRVGL